MNEYKNLVARKFQAYSQPHCALYGVIAEMLSYHPARVLEVGFGIGYGIQQLIQKNCLKYYVGIEPDKENYDYVMHQSKMPNLDRLINSGWLEADIGTEMFDFTLCIEVVEHTPKNLISQFVKKLHDHTKGVLFLSTPDINTNRHGIFTKAEIVEALKLSGFKDVVDIEWQIPFTLYMCKA